MTPSNGLLTCSWCRDNELVPGLAHCEFMQRYKEMFVSAQPQLLSSSALAK